MVTTTKSPIIVGHNNVLEPTLILVMKMNINVDDILVCVTYVL